MVIDSEDRKSRGVAPRGVPQLELREEIHDARHTLVLTGELDMAWASVLQTALHRICTDDADSIVLDLSKLTFMDSTGLRAILLAEELCEKHRCRFILIPGPPQVQRLFEVTGLLGRLPFQAPTDGM